MVLIERQQLWVANCVFMILLNGENYPVPARKSKVKYPTRPGKKYEIPDPLDTRKFKKMKYPTRSIPGKSLPDPSLGGIRKFSFIEKNFFKFYSKNQNVRSGR